MTLPDPIATTVTLLENTSAITALTSTRIYGMEVPQSQHNSMPQQAVIVKPAGNPGGAHGYMRYGKTRLDIWCLGATFYDAAQVYREVYPRLKHVNRETIGSVVVHDYTPTGGPLQLQDPETRWPCRSARNSR